MDGQETVGNSLERASSGGNEMEAGTSWTGRKPREIVWGELHWEGATTPNFIKIRLFRKICAPKTWQGVRLKEQGCWHRFFRTNSVNAIVPKNWCQRLLRRFLNAGHRDMHGKKFFAGAVFILHGVLSVDARLSLPSQRSKLNENPSIGYASA